MNCEKIKQTSQMFSKKLWQDVKESKDDDYAFVELYCGSIGVIHSFLYSICCLIGKARQALRILYTSKPSDIRTQLKLL